jgi:PDZ domain-containing protein
LTDDPELRATAAPQPPSATPPLPPSPDMPEPQPRARVSRWWWALLGFVVLVFVVAFVGFWVRLPYYTISPGGGLPVNDRVTVQGARTYPTKGEVFLLFVRERARVNVWRYLQAKLDPDIDLFPEQSFTGGRTPAQLRDQAIADMQNSQLAAKRVALEKLGYDVPPKGAVVFSTLPKSPASKVLKKGDVIVSVDGKPVRELSDLSKIITTHAPGDQVAVVVERDGTRVPVVMKTIKNPDGENAIIGVTVTQRYDFPVDIKIDTSDIGGPSAGLAMTLAIIDDLSPGDQTGGKRVAVTGTISGDGQVGEIGGIEQKAVAAKAADAQLFIVPKCTQPEGRAECLDELDRARKRSGDTPVVAVSTLDEALQALRKVGGAPVVQVANAN